MITTNDLQRLYVDMYKQIREYLWPFRIVEALADLEIACYKAFPDIDEVKKCFPRLSSEIKFQADKEDDEELLRSIEKFQKFLDDEGNMDGVYSKLDSVREVKDNEDK